MRIGDLVKDTGLDDVVMIVAENPNYNSSSGKIIKWDFEVYHGGVFYFVDVDELEEL